MSSRWDAWAAMVSHLDGQPLPELPGPPGRRHISPSAGATDPGLPAFERKQAVAAIRRRRALEALIATTPLPNPQTPAPGFRKKPQGHPQAGVNKP
jgi:hypothetical protein